MSLASALRPSNLSFSSPLSGVYAQATDASSVVSFRQDSNYLALNRMLIRFQNLILLTPSPFAPQDTFDESSSTDLTPLQRQIQAELYSPLPFHRTKWLHNIQGARNLLLQLERQAQGIKVQRTKREVLKDLSEKRTVIKRLRNRVEEIGREVENTGDRTRNLRSRPDEEDELLGDRVEDVLGHTLVSKPEVKTPRSHDLKAGKPYTQVEEEDGHDGKNNGDDEDKQRNSLFDSGVRKRQGMKGAAPTEHGQGSEIDKGKTSGFSNLASTEKSLASTSRTHEDLTASLVSMASQLKQQTRAFEFTLSQDKGLLDRALEGLDKNVSAMDLASRNMAYLTRMSEGEGWIGRMKLYAIIFAMWVAAILLVFVLPKLRF